jgi:acetylornithine deacetylase/succinyl-diaminopimelate desuccinylase-like protein
MRDVAALLTHPAVLAARTDVEARDAETVAFQAEVSAIPSPTGAETVRARRMARAFGDAGLRDVTTDDVGNVTGLWAGTGSAGEPPVVVASHLDTVFPAEQDVSVRRSGGRWIGPGITDNARGLAASATLARAIAAAQWRITRPILFAATVGEEGSGDLRGVKHLFITRKIAASALIALDGAGLDRVVHRALGARRFRAQYQGPGGHSWSAYGVPNPAHAAATFGAAIPDLTQPGPPMVACSVVGLRGGTGLNSIPSGAEVDIDLRSEDSRTLADAEARVRRAAGFALEQENARRKQGTPELTLRFDVIGDRPAGVTSAMHPLVQAAVAATRALGAEPELAASSTDANVPIALGIPSIALGAGGTAGDTHRPTEWYENTDGTLGLVRALVVLAVAAGIIGQSTREP